MPKYRVVVRLLVEQHMTVEAADAETAEEKACDTYELNEDDVFDVSVTSCEEIE